MFPRASRLGVTTLLAGVLILIVSVVAQLAVTDGLAETLWVAAAIVGAVVIGAAIGLRHRLRTREELSDRVALGASAGGMILAGAVLSQYPWRSVDGYIGHAWGVQLLALISVGALAASVVPIRLDGQQPALEDVGAASDAAGRDEPLGDATSPLGD